MNTDFYHSFTSFCNCSVSRLTALHLDSIVVFNIVVAILLHGGLFCTVHDLRK